MQPRLICTIGFLGIAVMGVGCSRRMSPEKWQAYINESEQQRAARMASHGQTDSGRTIGECRDGRPDFDYVCTRTYDFGRVHTTETIGYVVQHHDRWTARVLTQKHECPSGSSRPWNYGC